ncbi:MAG: HAMP domain-containing histidine kinase [Muribaculaceae bacterium]|jgi:two-component system sensor histidine kinase ArlS|nr:HAMP domain-containing histidine kinase [Muribaculaceae bacterium]
MKIQNKLSLVFSLIFGGILLIFIFGVYQFFSNKCTEDYFDRLHLRAAVKIDLIDGEYVAPDILQTMYENLPPNLEPQITVYNAADGSLIYRDKESGTPPPIYKSLVRQIRSNRLAVKTWDGNMQVYGFMIEGNKAMYVVMARGHDTQGTKQMNTLRNIMLVAFLIVMIAIILTVRLMTKQAFTPVSKMTDKVKDITLSNHLGIRLDEGNRKDELAKLAIMFNQMLASLEKSFDAQKQFVYNISHELRTPLSAIIAELELSKEKPESTNEDYLKAIDHALDDAHRLVVLSNNLLDMAKANYSPKEIAMHEIRIDELLLSECQKLQKIHPNYNIQLVFDQEDIDDDRAITINGNEYLLGVAFGNLVENGCKFSNDKKCEVHIAHNGKEMIIRVEDNGIGISKDDQLKIFTPFYRGLNKTYADGNGIGLSLAQRIFEIHDGKINLESEPGHTVFTVRLKNVL